MSTGGLTGAGGGSLAGTSPPPLQKQPDAALLTSYASAGVPKPNVPTREGGGDKAGADTKAGPVGDGWVQSDEQSQKLQDFDAVRGRANLGDEQENGGQEGSFVGCAAGAAKDVVVDTVKGTYETLKDAGGAVLDAGGAILNKAGVGGIDEDRTERTAARVDVVKDLGGRAWEAAKSPIETGGKILEAGGEILEAGKDELAEIGTEIKDGESCKLGERVGTTIGVGATIAVPGVAVFKGAKVLSKMGGKDGPDGPDARKETQDSGKAEGSDGNDTGKRVSDGGVEYKVTVDKPGWGETRRETDTLQDGIARRKIDDRDGVRYEAKELEKLGERGVNVTDRGADIEDIGRTEMPPGTTSGKLGEVDLETQDHIIEIHDGSGGKRKQITKNLNNPQINRDKDVILYSPNYSNHGTEFVDGVEVMKDAIGPNGERARIVRDIDTLADIVKPQE